MGSLMSQYNLSEQTICIPKGRKTVKLHRINKQCFIFKVLFVFCVKSL